MGERFTLSSGSVLRCQWRERSALSSGEKATPFTVTATTIFLPTEDPWRTGRALGLAHAAAVGRAMLQTVSQSGQRRHSHSRSASVPVKTFSLRISYFFANVFRWIASRGDSLTTHAIILTDSMSLLATKSEKWNGKPRLERVDGRHPSSKTPVGVLPWLCRSDGK